MNNRTVALSVTTIDESRLLGVLLDITSFPLTVESVRVAASRVVQEAAQVGTADIDTELFSRDLNPVFRPANGLLDAGAVLRVVLGLGPDASAADVALAAVELGRASFDPSAEEQLRIRMARNITSQGTAEAPGMNAREAAAFRDIFTPASPIRKTENQAPQKSGNPAAAAVPSTPARAALIDKLGIGGTQALVQILQQVAAGTLPRPQAISTIVLLFGVTEAEAAEMVPPQSSADIVPNADTIPKVAATLSASPSGDSVEQRIADEIMRQRMGISREMWDRYN